MVINGSEGGEGQEGIPEEVEVAFTLLYYFVDVSNVVKADVVVFAMAVTTVVVIGVVVLVVFIIVAVILAPKMLSYSLLCPAFSYLS